MGANLQRTTTAPVLVVHRTPGSSTPHSVDDEQGCIPHRWRDRHTLPPVLEGGKPGKAVGRRPSAVSRQPSAVSYQFWHGSSLLDELRRPEDDRCPMVPRRRIWRFSIGAW